MRSELPAKSLLAAALLCAPSLGAAAEPAAESPLVAYALELSPTEREDSYFTERELKAALHELERHPPPPGAECSQTLGASRFAEAYAYLGSVHFALGEFEESIEANEAALACSPRSAPRYGDIASAHLALGRIPAARAAVERGVSIDPEHPVLLRVRARVDFLEGRWADATARFRLAALDDEGANEPAEYDACFFWLAQRRAGVKTPEVLPPRDGKPDGWPAPILQTLTGEMTEAQLVQTIRDNGTPKIAREWLTEALYYVGELRLAEGDVATARKHFASVTHLKNLSFVEYGMARAELARLRNRD